MLNAMTSRVVAARYVADRARCSALGCRERAGRRCYARGRGIAWCHRRRRMSVGPSRLVRFHRLNLRRLAIAGGWYLGIHQTANGRTGRRDGSPLAGAPYHLAQPLESLRSWVSVDVSDRQRRVARGGVRCDRNFRGTPVKYGARPWYFPAHAADGARRLLLGNLRGRRKVGR